jgi:hypothetical protein
MVEVVEQIAARHELHHEAAVGVVLVVVQEGDDKGMVKGLRRHHLETRRTSTAYLEFIVLGVCTFARG